MVWICGARADEGTLSLRVEDGAFQAVPENVEAVCRSAAGELLRQFPDYEPPRLLVTKGTGDPFVAFGTNAQGEVVIRLTADSTFWCQYAYQFAHEFCHVLCGYENDDQANQWFEETLCETASLFAMRSMARAWKERPPYPNWVDYRDALRSYVDDVINGRGETGRELARDGLSAFYAKHAAELARNCCNRSLNGAMADILLHLLEAHPEHWAAVRWLNSSPSPKGETFRQYMAKWLDAVPENHKPFVRSVAELFGVGG